jgi:hypothetical protein
MADVSSRELLRLDVAPVKDTMRRAAPVLAFALAIAMSYGYEIFSFHLTLDEELFGEATSSSYALLWLSQGRWAMGALTLLVPSPVVPVVSTLLGVVLTAAAVWIVCRRCLDLGRWPTAAAASLACTLPTLSFMFSFSTIAYGIGVGNALLAVYFVCISSASWLRRAIGVVAFAFAIGIYDSFLVAGVALALAVLCSRPTWFKTALVLASIGLAFALSKLIAAVSQWAFGVGQDAYVGQFVDVAGLVSDPSSRLKRALASVWDVAFLSEERFGLHSPWLGVVLAALVGLAIAGALRADGVRGKVVHLLGLAALLALPVAMELVAMAPVLLRSMVYLPMIVAVLAGWAVRGMATLPSRPAAIASGLLAALTVLAVVGQATISNRLFAASEMTYAQDQNLAFDIGQEKERLVQTEPGENVALYISGTHEWPTSVLVPAKENLGVSFFAGQAGPDALQYRTAAFLRSQGIAVRMPDGKEMERSKITAASMPSYPEAGWISYSQGVLVVNFGVSVP